jgi:diacylglycerol kinase family enzyme
VPDLLQRPEATVEVDGRVVHQGPMELLVVSTTPWYGRGLLVNPGARPDRGELVTRVYRGPLPRFAMDAMRWVAKRRPATPAVAGHEVVVRTPDDQPLTVQADGDVVDRRSEWRMGIHPAAVTIIGRW